MVYKSDLDIEFTLESNNRGSTCITGSYDADNKLIKVYLHESLKVFEDQFFMFSENINIDDFIEGLTDTLAHETFHYVIHEEIMRHGLMGMKMPHTNQEYCVRRIMGQKMQWDTLLHYAYSDGVNEGFLRLKDVLKGYKMLMLKGFVSLYFALIMFLVLMMIKFLVMGSLT